MKLKVINRKHDDDDDNKNDNKINDDDKTQSLFFPIPPLSANRAPVTAFI